MSVWYCSERLQEAGIQGNLLLLLRDLEAVYYALSIRSKLEGKLS
jgi:hypothetical protein